jgi:hypothetical protein
LVSTNLPSFISDTQSSLPLEPMPALLLRLWNRNKDGYLCVS